MNPNETFTELAARYFAKVGLDRIRLKFHFHEAAEEPEILELLYDDYPQLLDESHKGE